MQFHNFTTFAKEGTSESDRIQSRANLEIASTAADVVECVTARRERVLIVTAGHQRTGKSTIADQFMGKVFDELEPVVAILSKYTHNNSKTSSDNNKTDTTTVPVKDETKKKGESSPPTRRTNVVTLSPPSGPPPGSAPTGRVRSNSNAQRVATIPPLSLDSNNNKNSNTGSRRSSVGSRRGSSSNESGTDMYAQTARPSTTSNSKNKTEEAVQSSTYSGGGVRGEPLSSISATSSLARRGSVGSKLRGTSPSTTTHRLPSVQPPPPDSNSNQQHKGFRRRASSVKAPSVSAQSTSTATIPPPPPSSQPPQRRGSGSAKEPSPPPARRSSKASLVITEDPQPTPSEEHTQKQQQQQQQQTSQESTFTHR
eukprot:PhM_4_TR14136/c0_g1_i3/m.39353